MAQIEEAFRIFEDMVARGCERNVITYSSLITACEKAGRWELALQVLDEMHQEGCKPNVVTYNSLLGACAQGLPLCFRQNFGLQKGVEHISLTSLKQFVEDSTFSSRECEGDMGK